MRYLCYVYRLPLRHKFRGITYRDGLLLRPDPEFTSDSVADAGAGGPQQWAEVSPFWDYGPQYAARWLAAGLAALQQEFPTAQRTAVPVNVTIPAVDAETAYQIAHGSQCHTAKVKIAEPGQTLADDVARLEAVRAALPASAIRVDVNGKWEVDQAVANIRELDRAAGGLEYVEQPCATVAELAQVRRRVDTPIAADESIRQSSDPLAVKRLAAADIAVIKNQPLGGVAAALELVEQLDMPAVVSSALESSVGLRAGLALAAALDQLPHACGLATAQLFTTDVTSAPLLPVAGVITLRPVVPDQLPVPDAALVARWAARLAQMWDVLVAAGQLPPDVTYRFADNAEYQNRGEEE
ncbi:MAG: o-succinylbenzoate synthase [Trueperella sp.]|nr:o-succinylbenzoate synthase [Trueperella sp.]